jgi:hypothetical protein
MARLTIAFFDHDHFDLAIGATLREDLVADVTSERVGPGADPKEVWALALREADPKVDGGLASPRCAGHRQASIASATSLRVPCWRAWTGLRTLRGQCRQRLAGHRTSAAELSDRGPRVLLGASHASAAERRAQRRPKA